jgi:hypothetical protein
MKQRVEKKHAKQRGDDQSDEWFEHDASPVKDWRKRARMR